MMENKTKIDLKNTSIFITGAAGFIGSNLAKRILTTVEGAKVVGLDNMNHYYDVRLKEARLDELNKFENFSFVKGNLADKETITTIFEQYKPQIVVNLGAQAGVRYSITNILKITLKNDALNSLYARYGNLCHLLLGVSLFLILYVIYKKFLQHISGIAHILKLSDKYSYDIYLAHHIYILGPLSILSLQISTFSKIIILIGLISAQSIIVHKASALLNQLKISD